LNSFIHRTNHPIKKLAIEKIFAVSGLDLQIEKHLYISYQSIFSYLGNQAYHEVKTTTLFQSLENHFANLAEATHHHHQIGGNS
jgi:hypothetical protein